MVSPVAVTSAPPRHRGATALTWSTKRLGAGAVHVRVSAHLQARPSGNSLIRVMSGGRLCRRLGGQRPAHVHRSPSARIASASIGFPRPGRRRPTAADRRRCAARDISAGSFARLGSSCRGRPAQPAGSSGESSVTGGAVPVLSATASWIRASFAVLIDQLSRLVDQAAWRPAAASVPLRLGRHRQLGAMMSIVQKVW